MSAISATVETWSGMPLERGDLPPLREDLELLPAPRQPDGSPAWMLYDPVRHQFFRIGWREFEILNRWPLGNAQAVSTAARRETTLTVTPEHVLQVERFCRSNQLLQSWEKSPGLHAGERRPGFFARLLSLLYQRLPLCRPDGFLGATLPLARPWFLKGFWQVIFLLALLGAFLTLRQWEQFLQTFLYFYSVEGAVYFALSLTLVKAGHELAHAYTAKNFGLKVPVMGVAFIIFWPVLYTDTTDAWKLTAKKQRLQIGIAGVAFELATAVFATLFWHLLPMGPWKGAMFMLASSTWILTLTVNLNPFMRFDGYYILSDLLGIPNLQQRSFELARWFLRRFLLGADLPCPESLPWEQRALLIAYGYAVWAYRLFLYSGIALLVYHFFFKALGLLLFAGEIGLLICLPVMGEIKVWFRMRSQLKVNVRMLFSAALLLLGLALFFYPWNTSIHIPAISKARNFSRIFAPEGARIKENLLARGREVKEGESLVVLDSPEIEYRKKQAAQDVQLLQTQISRSSFFEEHAEQLPIREQELVEALTALAGAGEQEKRLTIRSPIRGVVSDVADSLVPGRWLKESDQLAAVVDLQHPVIEGYVHEQDQSRICKGQRGIFYFSDTEIPEIAVEIKNIAGSHTVELDAPYLASVYGGDLPVRVGENGTLRLLQSFYKVEMEPIAGPPAGCILRGTVKIQGEPVSFAARAWTALQAVVIRESEF